MKQLLNLLLVLSFFTLQAQINEHFSDGNFSSNPQWIGDDSLFQVNTNLQLQSKGTVAKEIYLSTSNSFIDSAEWQCLVRFNLSPSTQNFCKFYLVSDQQNLKGILNGYFVQFGGVTGNTDSITLYKQKGNTFFRIIGGRPSTVSKTSNIVRIKVIRDKIGGWQLFSDTLGGINFVLEGTGTDNEFLTSSYCGYDVRFTTTNSANYFLDDIYVGPILIDHTPPKLDTVILINPTTLSLKFSESIDSASAFTLSNFIVNNGIGIPVKAVFDNGNDSILILQFQHNFVNETNYTISVFGINDLNGNTLLSQNYSFIFFIPQKNDVLISEFFPDPSPQILLPSEEFIELFNRSGYSINLSGWILTDGTSTAVFPDAYIKPDSFIIVCANTSTILFSGYGKTVGLSNFPSLNNSGDMILLKDKSGNIVHQINYDLSWYGDQLKENGGWTIEMKSPYDLCKGKNNFSASLDSRGGTPGAANSIWNKFSDSIPPQMISVEAKSANEIELIFNETMDSNSMMNSSILISNGVMAISKNCKGEFFDTLEILLNPKLSGNIFYTISVSDAKDCSQNLIANQTTKTFIFYSPDTAKSFDIVIDEILADPDPTVGLPNQEFLELYNKSTRVISLNNWTIEDASSKAILPNILLLPDSFIIVTSTNANNLFSKFGTSVGVSNFPSLGNDIDSLVLKNEKGQVIHAINYTSDWYQNNTKKIGGWTLEMIDPKNPCAGSNNWSASKNNNGGTPGKQNSIHAINRDNEAPQLTHAYLLNGNEVKLTFNEPLDSSVILSNVSVSVNPFGASQKLKLQSNYYNIFSAKFNDTFQTKNVYRILVSGVKDCVGNSISENDYADFGVPESFDTGDIAINEILFNPNSGGVDFVELYNKSDKVIDLKKLFIANTNADNAINDVFQISPQGFILFPKNHCALSSNTEILKQQYFSSNTKNYIQCTMPSFPDNAGTVAIVDAVGNRYDQFSYDDKMHFPLLDNKAGVSLERIDFNRPTNDRTNWTSAASQVNATPAYRNSQYALGNANGEHLNIEPEVFSPDGDGYKDMVNFSYSFNESGYVGNLFLYDSRGVMVKQILHNTILGTSGTYSWNGFSDKNEKAPIGIYMVYFEVFNLKGEVNNYRSTVVLGGKL